MATAKNVSFSASNAMLTMPECIDMIQHTGMNISWLIQGDMGSGKTSILKELVKRTGMPGVYFDCTTKDLGDLFLPDIYRENGAAQCVSFVPNEEFGIHLNRPFILMLDEMGKNRSIQNGLLRVLQERSVGSRALPEGSIVFGTTNLGGENVGDMLAPHARNRIGVVRMRKPDADLWKAWAADNDIDHTVYAFAHEFPMIFASFTEVDKPDENQYIYDPRDAGRTAFVTGRSLHKLSDLAKKRHLVGDNVLRQGAVGLIGAKAANDYFTLVSLDDTLETYEEVALHPMKAKVPDTAAGQIMMCLKCMSRVDEKEFRNVFEYIKRLPMEMQALFANQLIKSPSKAPWVARQSSFTQFAQTNYGLFSQ